MTKVVTEYTAKIKSNLPKHLDKTAKSAKSATKELDKTKKAAAGLSGSRVTSGGGIEQMGEQAEHAAGGMKKATIALVGLYAAYKGFMHFVARADEWTNMSNKLQQVTANSLELEAVQKRLVSLSIETRSDLAAVVTTYQRVGRAIERTGASSEDTYNVVKALSLGIKTTGIASDEARQALRQITQAFNKGKLDGDEFRSVAENMPVVLDAIADKAQISRGELMKWARQGKITSELMTQGLLEALPQLEADFKKIKPTVSDTSESVSAAWTEMIGTIADSTNVLSPVISAMNTLADSLRYVSTSLEQWEARETSIEDAVTQGGKALARRAKIALDAKETLDRLGGDKNAPFYQKLVRDIEILELARKSPTSGGGPGVYAEESNPVKKLLEELKIDRETLQERRAAGVLTPELFQSEIKGLSGRAQRGALDDQTANILAGDPELLKKYQDELDIIKSLIETREESNKGLSEEEKRINSVEKSLGGLGKEADYLDSTLKKQAIGKYDEEIIKLGDSQEELYLKNKDLIDQNPKLSKMYQDQKVQIDEEIDQANRRITVQERMNELLAEEIELDEAELELEQELTEQQEKNIEIMKKAIRSLGAEAVDAFSELGKSASGQTTPASRLGQAHAEGIRSGNPAEWLGRVGMQFGFEIGNAVVKIAKGNVETKDRYVETQSQRDFYNLMGRQSKLIDKLEKEGVYSPEIAEQKREETKESALDYIVQNPEQALRWLKSPHFFELENEQLKALGITSKKDLARVIEERNEIVEDELSKTNRLLEAQLNLTREQARIEQESLELQVEAQRRELDLRAAEARDAVAREVVSAYRTPITTGTTATAPVIDVNVQIVDDPQRIDRRIQSPEGSASVTKVAHVNSDEYGDVVS